MICNKHAKKTSAILVLTLLAVSTVGCLSSSASLGYVVVHAPPSPQNGTKPSQISKYTIEQTLSDGAQRATIAFDGLAFLTGNLGADSFLPPGKTADFFGFQYLRDNDLDNMGHNTDFLTRVANNVLYIISSDQKTQLVNLAKNQVNLINKYAYDRFPLMKAFRRQLEGDVPQGSTGLSRSAVMEYSASLYSLSVTVSLQRAIVYGGILSSLNQTQRNYLNNMAATGMLSWPQLGDQIDKRSLSHDEHVAVMTYASDIFSWYAGSVDADTYFCPEGQGTYFGSFYMKDAPAMGNPDYSIGTDITGKMGEAFLSLLTDSQRQLVTGLVDIQRADLNEIVAKRRAIAVELRRLMTGGSVDEGTLMSLGRRYGELDGEISYYYATHFAQLSKNLSSTQKTQLTSLRKQLLGDMVPSGAFLYSEPIPMPTIMNTDFLFDVYTSTTITSSSMTTTTTSTTGVTTSAMTTASTTSLLGGKGSTRLVLSISPTPGYINQQIIISGTLYGSWGPIKDGVVVGKPVNITTGWGYKTIATTGSDGKFTASTICPATGGTHKIGATFVEDSELTGSQISVNYQILAYVETTLALGHRYESGAMGGSRLFYGYLKRKDTGQGVGGMPVRLTIYSGGYSYIFDVTTRSDGYFEYRFTTNGGIFTWAETRFAGSGLYQASFSGRIYP